MLGIKSTEVTVTSHTTITMSTCEEVVTAQGVTVEDAKEFVLNAMTSIGTRASHASLLADALVLADQRGQFTHGLHKIGKLPSYCKY